MRFNFLHLHELLNVIDCQEIAFQSYPPNDRDCNALPSFVRVFFRFLHRRIPRSPRGEQRHLYRLPRFPFAHWISPRALAHSRIAGIKG
jgi:hypothetical protein